ncbi:hypothetical protein GBA52_015230 [Prunus armeniaca]|nr:hypothetical protein GBA52_015230 [Prunus armeniaca]
MVTSGGECFGTHLVAGGGWSWPEKSLEVTSLGIDAGNRYGCKEKREREMKKNGTDFMAGDSRMTLESSSDITGVVVRFRYFLSVAGHEGFGTNLARIGVEMNTGEYRATELVAGQPAIGIADIFS